MTTQQIGALIRETRKSLKLTQEDLALASGTARRFISELENGKPGCRLELTFSVLRALGIRIEMIPPTGVASDE